MNRIRFQLLFSTLLLIAVAAGTMFLPRLNTQAQAPVAAAAAPESATNTITVVGQGQVTARPDRARLSIGVESFSASAEEANEDNATRMERVLAALEGAGISKEKLSTAYFSIWTESSPMGPESSSMPTSRYRVSNQINVIVEDTTQVSALIDLAISAGATSITGVNYEMKDRTAPESQSRAAAVRDAEARAAELAALNGATVGKVVEVSEVIGNVAPMRGEMGSGGGAPLNPGELNFNTQVQITYELVR